MSQTIEQLAAEVRHLTARIPREAAPATHVRAYKSVAQSSSARSCAMKASHARPEVKAKISASTRARWSDPVYRAKAIASRGGPNPGVRSCWADPIWREQQIARIAAGRVRRRMERSQ